MKRRYALLGMTVLLAAALAVPAFGGPTNPVSDTFASAKKTAKKALSKAKQANRKAKDAKKAANNAQGAADTAQGAASDANKAAGSAQSSATTADQKAIGASLAAGAAQSSADAAQATANSSYSDYATSTTATASNMVNVKTIAASCGAEGKLATGGGYEIFGDNDEITVTNNRVDPVANAWTVTAEEISGTTPAAWSVRVYAYCIGPPGSGD